MPPSAQYVVSTTLAGVADPEIELVRTDPVELVRRLEKEDGPQGKDIWLCGGVPVLRGNFRPALFTPVRRQEFGNGAQVTWFDRV